MISGIFIVFFEEYHISYCDSHSILCVVWTSAPLGGSGGMLTRKKSLYVLKINS